MQYLRWRAQFGFCALVICLFLGTRSARGESAQDQLPACDPFLSHEALQDGCHYGNIILKETSFDVAQMVFSKDDSKKPAKTIELTELIQRLGALDPKERCGTQATKALLLRQEIAEMVSTASLEVHGYVAEIDSESGKIREVHDSLSDRRDRAVGISTLGSAGGTGGGAVGSALALGTEAAMTAGSWVGAVAGGVGTLFSFLGYYQAKGPRGCFPATTKDCPDLKKPVILIDRSNDKHKDDCTVDNCSPSLLSYFLFKMDPGFHSAPDSIVDKYLDSHRRQLNGLWGFKDNTIEELKATHQVSKDDKAMETLITTNTAPRKLSIDDLTDRANKLADVRTVVSRMNRDLSRLMDDLAKNLRCEP
jgi:hypothetical protein